MSALRDFLEAELDNRGAAGSDETDYYEEARQALEAYDALQADRDALASDLAMRGHELKLAYDCREALGWNKLTALSLMPDAIKRLVSERAELAAPTPRPIAEYHEDMGDVLWWKFPIEEPPYAGTPNDLGQAVEILVSTFDADQRLTANVGGWPGYHTHFTPIPRPKEPAK